MFDREVLESMMKAGELSARVKELEVSLEMAELSKQNAEKDCALAKEKAESSALEVKHLELMVINTRSSCVISFHFASIAIPLVFTHLI